MWESVSKGYCVPVCVVGRHRIPQSKNKNADCTGNKFSFRHKEREVIKHDLVKS